MTCNEIKEMLSLYIDNMLEPDQAAVVENHLADCDSCRLEYQELKNIVYILGNIEELPLPEAFGPRLKQALQQEKENTKVASVNKAFFGHRLGNKSINWRIIGSIAAIFAVGILTYGMYNDIMDVVPNKLNTAYEQINNETRNHTEKQKESGSTIKAGSMEDREEDLNTNLNKNLDSDTIIDEGNALQDNQPLMALDSRAGSGNVDTNNASSKENSASDELTSNDDVYVTSRAFQDHTMQNTAEAKSNPDLLASKPSAGRHFLAAAPENSNFKEALPPDMTISPDRNTAAIKYYTLQIEDKLAGYDYQIINNSYDQNGEWQFRVFIFTGKDGNTYNQEILITGKNGEISVQDANELMGL